MHLPFMKKKRRSFIETVTDITCWGPVCRRYLKRKKKMGFSLIEVLIIVAILGVISVSSIFAYQSITARGRDSERKSDLQRIATALEEYYNDHACYPARADLLTCGKSELSPYLSEYPCDPANEQPYLYVPADDQCDGYRLQAHLENESDPIIAKLGCDGAYGCGYTPTYNYGVSSGVSLTSSEPLPQPSASPGTYGGNFACDPEGACNSYADPEVAGCPISFAQTNCQNVCSNPAYRCAQ